MMKVLKLRSGGSILSLIAFFNGGALVKHTFNKLIIKGRHFQTNLFVQD